MKYRAVKVPEESLIKIGDSFHLSALARIFGVAPGILGALAAHCSSIEMLGGYEFEPSSE